MAMQIIKILPFEGHEKLKSGDLFKVLTEAGNWKYEKIAEELGVSVDTVKGWANREVRPTGETRIKLIKMIYDFSLKNEIAEKWTHALEMSWTRSRVESKKDSIGKTICELALKNLRLINLPAIFESDHNMPLATAYIELQLTPSAPVKNNPQLLNTNLSLREKLNKNNESRYTVRKSPRELLDDIAFKSTLILGSPGTGKSSLLRQISIDIAKAEWDLYKVPLFIEARAYWMARKSGVNTNLLSYAVSAMLPIGYDIEEAVALLLEKQKTQPFVLLLDGLDEIASDSIAVNTIYDELKHLSISIPWIVTARPSGVVASLEPVRHCDIIGLDEDSIESLIDNWCESTKKPFKSLDAEHLKLEIFGSSSMREMAQNPFLLTALCYLKSISPSVDLPITRIAIYETLIDKIALQAQQRLGNVKILNPTILEELQNFVLSLYNRPDGVIQVFDRGHWHEFSKGNSKITIDDLENNILPSQLISDWMGTKTHFHFLHLSMQEHLIARAMIDQSLENALERRFIPAWRAVFRFYGALLLQQNKVQDFRHLVQVLYKEQDINRLSFLDLTSIFADAGIKDTKDWIGEDLREELYISAMSGHDAGPESMYDVLALLDPAWLEKAICAEMDEYLDLYEQGLIERNIEGEDFWSIATEDWHDSPYEQLAKARTGSAKAIIANAFWGDNQYRAIIAAHAYASVATPSERQNIVKKAASVSMSDNLAIRIFAFSRGLHRTEFIPFLDRILNYFSAKDCHHFIYALNLIADIGGRKAALTLEKLARAEIKRLSDDFNSFEVIIKAVVRLGGGLAIQILEKLESIPQDYPWKDALPFLKFEADPSPEKDVIAALSQNGFTYSETLSALAGAANFARIPSKSIVEEINRHIDKHSVTDIMDLSYIESSRVEVGEAPILCEKLLTMAELHYKRIHDKSDDNERDYLLTNVQLIFDTLGQARWKPSVKLINTILNDKYSNEDLLESVVTLAGLVFSGTSEQSILRHLKEILFQQDGEHSFTAALAIGRIDLEELFRLQSAEDAMYALEELAAESNLLIFDEFWVDRLGNKTQWQKPPKKIFYAYNDDIPEIPQLFSHELSRYGFCFEIDKPETCVAYLVFDEVKGYWENVAKNLSGLECPLFSIPKGLTEETARVMAREIGIEFLSKYELMQPPSSPIHF